MLVVSGPPKRMGRGARHIMQRMPRTVMIGPRMGPDGTRGRIAVCETSVVGVPGSLESLHQKLHKHGIGRVEPSVGSVAIGEPRRFGVLGTVTAHRSTVRCVYNQKSACACRICMYRCVPQRFLIPGADRLCSLLVGKRSD